MFDRLYALETFGIKLGLENISALCAALGHPERAFASVHVAGTNGKGSVTAMVHAGLVAAGVRAARFISPHLVDLAERFVIGGQQVYEEALKYPECQKIYVTQIHQAFGCDVFFRDFKDRFVKTKESTRHNEGPLNYHFEEYELKSN